MNNMEEMFITNTVKKIIKSHGNNCAHGIHFYIKVHMMIQQKLANPTMIQQQLWWPNLCKLGLFLHFQEIAYAGSCGNYS